MSCRETAQTCYCGAANCRGVIGGVKTYPTRPQDARDVYDSRETKTRREKRRKDRFSDILVSAPLSALLLFLYSVATFFSMTLI